MSNKTKSLLKNLISGLFFGRLKLAFRVTRSPKNVVVSPGGVGTTALIEYLQGFTEINCYRDEDGIKHLPTPRLIRRANIIFISSQPQPVVSSLTRRGYHWAQALKLGVPIHILLIRRKSLSRLLEKAITKQEKSYTSYHGVLVIPSEILHESAIAIADQFDIGEKDEFVSSYPIYKRG